MNIIKHLFLFLSLLFCTDIILAQHVINLSGEWQFQIDRQDVGEQEGWYNADFQFNDRINLPASMAERMKGDDISVNTQWVGSLYDSSYYFNPYMEKYRIEGQMKLPFFLTPDKHYVGKAWYKRTVDLGMPREYEIYLERPHIISEVWVNGKKVEMEGLQHNSLSVPHVFPVTKYLKKGSNTIAICIDNDPKKVNVGMDSHSVTDQTQGCWNGIVGKMQLRERSYIASVKVYPDVDARKVDVKVTLNAPKYKPELVEIRLKAEAFNTDKQHAVTSAPVIVDMQVNADVTETITLNMGEDALLWDEFNPQLYRLTVEAKTRKVSHKTEEVFGMRKIEIRDKMFYVNGKEILLRGTVENCLFPVTGYPPTDLDSWLKIYRRCKEYGFNHMRFHSYCPPEAAFLAADMTGFYIQPEGPSWPNHGVKLGRGEFIDTYLYDEAVRICDEYGNHPSFAFFAFGNEPAGNWVKWCSEKTPLIKEYDPRHIYAGFSVGGGWAWQPKTEYAVKAGARGLDSWNKTAPESMADFSDKITTYNGKDAPGTPITIPFVTHEMGQWCAFPNFDEIMKYKGVNKAKNFEIFRDLLRDNGMKSMAKKFLNASGKLQLLCYKYETERILRTPNYAGYQMLSLNDYSGQGTALVGVTDVFFDDKGYCTAEDFHEFNSTVVPLAKFPKFTYENTETFSAELSVANFSGRQLPELIWQIKDGDATIAGGNGNVVNLPLSRFTEPKKLTLYATVGEEGINHWNFWVYPSKHNTTYSTTNGFGNAAMNSFEGSVYVTDSFNDKAQEVLSKGGKVLICAAGKVTYGREVKQRFTPVFWNTSWFKMRPPHTTGIYVDNNHGAFNLFPTDTHSDMQWWELVNNAQVMQFTNFHRDFQPIIQSIDTWFVSRKIGMLFEANVGNGKLMMTTMDITSNLDKRIAARQMRRSILSYMNSRSFQPIWDVNKKLIKELFTKVAGEVNMFTNDSPDELKPSLDNSAKKK